MSAEIVEVAVGVLIREDGRVLLSSRPQGKPYAGYWEFPGGKIEAGETAEEALKRELKEELGITMNSSHPWFVKEHTYEHARVRLHFRISRDFSGVVSPLEGQQFGFFNSTEKTPGAVLPADVDIVKRAEMPQIFQRTSDYKILGRDTLFSIVERKHDVKYLGAVVSTVDEVLKAKAMDFDFVVVEPKDFDVVLKNGEPMIPTYVKAESAAEIADWLARGAHGIF